MRTNLLIAPPRIDQSFMVRLLQQLTQVLGRCVSSDEAAPRIILLSKDPVTGAPTKAWDVTVDDAGTLVVTQNPGGRP